MKLYKLLLLVFTLFTATQASSQVVASFTATPTSGCAPLYVSFTNLSTPTGGTTYSWTFGASAGVSTITNPTVFFPTPGVHVVTLVATNGGVSSTYTMPITVHPQPTVNFVASDTTVCPNTPITFTSTTVGGVTGTITCTWYWGDGSNSTGSPATHSYASPGDYTVSLFATNAMGCQSSIVKANHIHVYPRPTAILIGPFTACNPPASITFSTPSAGAPPLSYSWIFGGPGGGTATGPTPTHPYATTGTFPVKLIVTDGNGCVDSATSSAVISNVTASFTGPDSACVFAPVSFTSTSTGVVSYTWNFGDGGTSSSSGTHAYSGPGTYTVTLTVVNGTCTLTATRTIRIMDGPTTDFTMDPVHPCPAPVSITYTGTSTAPGTTYSWTFSPSGGTGAGSPISHLWPSNGVKTVTMVAVNPINGCRDTVTKRDTIYNLWFDAFAGPRRGCVPLTVTFGGDALTSEPNPPGVTHAYPLPVSSYSWDFGDGSTPGSGPTPSHTYTAVGIYTATVTITTSNGCTAIDTLRIEVGAPPQVTFSATPRHICYSSHTPIVFTPTVVVGPVDEYHWTFGDGGGTVYDTANPPNTVSHVYSVPGTFTVTVIPYWRGCPGVPFTIVNYIIIDSPKAIIGDSIFCTPNTRVKFWDSSLGDDTHLWMFGDGTTSTVDDPIHDYPSTGVYTVRLATYNNLSGCRDTATQTMVLSGPVPDFVVSNPLPCRGETVTLTSTTSSPGYVVSYRWFVDGVTVPGATNTTYNIAPDTGYHTVRLVIRNINGCYDTLTRTAFIHVAGPRVSFTGGPLSGCVPITVTFTDASTAVSTTTIVSYFWRFFDGTTGTGVPISHTYTAAGVYTVREIVTDSRGCVDSFTRPSYINATKPVAAFSGGPVNACVNAPVTFSITSPTSPAVATASWDFGDGGTSTSLSPSHVYAVPGFYTVRLSITDVIGCTDDTIRTAYISISKPHAQFKMSDSISVCPPLFVNFTNLSVGASSYNWDFGDGITSVIPSPTNMYITSALYNVRLIATDIYGCKDTVSRPVNIFGYAGAFSYAPAQGCVPLAVHFSASLSNVPFITWDFSDGVTSSISFSDTITHVYLVPGAYIPKLILSDNTGCQTASIGDTIFVDQITPKSTTFPNPVCVGVPFNFIDSSTSLWSPINTWEWNYDGNTSTTASPSYTVYAAGSYSVTLKVTNTWGCVGFASTSVVVDPPPDVTVSRDTIVCVGDPATLIGYGALTYTWDPPVSLSCTACNPTYASPTTQTTYTVTGTDSRGCIDTASVTVRLRTHTIAKAWGDTAVCKGVTVQLFDTGGTTYLWLPPLGLNSNTIYNPLATAPYTTVYMAIAKLAGCIADTNTVVVTIWPLPTVDAGPDQRLLAGSTADLKATGKNIATYEWWPGETLSCTDCFNPVASMTMNTTYNVNVVSDRGCKASDSVNILLYCDNSMVFIPNAFTPNGDGQNDVFYPRGQGLKTIKTFRIYNRWGELLFEREGINLNDASNGWDGSYKGDAPRPDVYVYILSAICYTGEDVNIKGDVTILR